MNERSPQVKDPLADFQVNTESVTPPFRQLYNAVVGAVGDGNLLPGQRLPPIRALATRLGLAVNTVAASYRSLEEANVVEGRGRAGTFVRLGDDPIEAEAHRIALDAIAALRQLGIEGEHAARIFNEAAHAQR